MYIYCAYNAKCLYVYIPVCSCTNWVTSAKLCVFICQSYSYMCWCVHAGCVDIYMYVGLNAGWVGVYARCVGAHAMCLGVLPDLYAYMNVSASGTNSNILRHKYQWIQAATWFCRLHGLCVLKVSTSNVSIVVVNCHNNRNVLRMTLLSMQSTVSPFLLRSVVNRILCLLSTVS